MTTLTWLHLSDVHVCDARYGYQSLQLRQRLCADLARMQKRQELWPDFIFFTGDLVYGHLGEGAGLKMADQYQEAQVFLDQVRASFDPEIPRERLFLVPGNHDVNRGKITPDQSWWLKNKANPTEIVAMIRDADLQWRRVMERLGDYKAFLEQNGYDHLLADPDRLIYHATFAVGNGLSLGIAGLNSAWSCARDREKGALWLGALWQTGTVLSPLAAADLRVALIHHPVTWLNASEDPSIELRFQGDCDFYLHGHEHEAWVFQLPGCVRIAADATHDHARPETRDNGYNFVRLDLLTGAGEVWLRSYEPVGGGWIPKVIYDHTDTEGCWRLTPSTRLQERLALRAAGAAPPSAVALGPVEAAAAQLAPEPAEAAPVDDWGQAPDVAAFHGRQEDIEQCRQWIESQACKVIGIFGGAGIGKTLFATKVARDVRSHFEFVFWRSLASAPPLPELLRECLLLVTRQQDLEAAMPLDQLFLQLINNFRGARCLMVLDDFDTVLEAGDEAGRYLDGYESYGQLITLLGSTPHISCLLVTSSEEPNELHVLARAESPVRAYALGKLSVNEVKVILQDKGLSGNDSDWQRLTEHYSGNPLALKLVSETIFAMFSGSVLRFLESGETLSGDLMVLLEKHFERVTPMERQICYWLAIAREGSSLEELAGDILGPQELLRYNIQEALGSLRRRSLLEETNARFSLPNVVAAFLINKLVATAYDEIADGAPALISSHSLMKGRDKDYSREAQARLILKPISDRLLASIEKKGVVAAAGKLLAICKHDPSKGQGYLGGNVVNLLAQAGIDLTNWVFSGITIWQAYLRGVELHSVDFSYCDLSRSVFTEVLSAVMSVAVSPDGQCFAAADLAGVITLWSLADNGKRGTLSGHNGRVWSVCFVDSGKQLASCGIDMTVRLWDLSTMRERTVLLGHTSWIGQLAATADGALLASVGGDRTVRLWSVASGECLAVREADTQALHAVRFRPGDQTIVLATAGSDGRICLWDVREPSSVRQLADWPAHDEPVYALAFSPDGQLLASGGAGHTIKLWRLDEEGEQRPTTWRPQLLHTLHGHEGEVSSLAFDADGSILASGSHDSRVKVWSLPKDAAPECRSTLFGHSSGIHSIAFASAKTLVSGGDDLTVRQWEIPSGRSLVTLQGHASWINAVAISADGDTLATGSDDRVVRLWSIKDGSCRVLREHTGKVTSVAMTADGALLASGCDDGVVRLWDLKSEQCIRRFVGHTSAVKSIAISPGSDVLVSCGLDHTLRIWDFHSARSRLVLRERFDLATSAAVNSTGGLIAASCADQRIRVWRLDTGELQQIFIGHEEGVKAVAFGPDDLLASGGGDKLVKLWDLATGRSRSALAGHLNQVTSVAFSPDGGTIASGSIDTTVRLWDSKTAAFRSALTGHQQGVHAVAFSGDGSRLVSGSADETAKLWDLEESRELAEFKNPQLYGGMKITGARGISEAEKASLLALGAVDS